MLNIIRRIRTKRIRLLFLFVVFLLIISALHPTFELDESYTFGLIKHDYLDIINLNSMDVHPPLYYIILKLFLSCSTFWTRSVLIKVIMARLLSLLVLGASIYFCMKVLNIYHIKYYMSTILVFLLMPSILQRSLEIRMYSLSVLFIVLEFYYLIKFSKFDRIIYIFDAAIFISLSAYTFYFAGLSAGILLLIYCLIYLFNKKIRRVIDILIGFVLVLIIYMPQVPFVLIQIKRHTHIDNGTWVSAIKALPGSIINAPSIFIIIPLFISFMYLIIFSFSNMSRLFNKLLMILIIDLLFTIMVSFIICGKEFQAGISYPINFLIMFMICVILDFSLHKNNRNIGHIISLLLVFIIMLTSVAYGAVNIKKYDIPSITLIKNISRWKQDKSKDVEINLNKYPISEQMTASEDAVYLKPIGKNAIVKDYKYSELSAGLLNSYKNTKLVKQTFNNLKVRND